MRSSPAPSLSPVSFPAALSVSEITRSTLTVFSKSRSTHRYHREVCFSVPLPGTLITGKFLARVVSQHVVFQVTLLTEDPVAERARGFASVQRLVVSEGRRSEEPSATHLAIFASASHPL